MKEFVDDIKNGKVEGKTYSNIKWLISSNTNSRFINCEFKEGFEITVKTNITTSLTFHDCTFENFSSSFFLSLNGNSRIQFVRCLLKVKVEVNQVQYFSSINSYIGGIIFKRSNYMGIDLLNDILDKKQPLFDPCIDNIEFNGAYEDRCVSHFYNLKVKSVHFSNDIPNNCIIEGGDYNSLIFKRINKNNNLKIIGDNAYSGNIQINELRFEQSLNGSVIVNKAEINFLNLKAQNWTEKNLIIQNVKIIEEFNCIETNLGNATFTGVNFSSARLLMNWSSLTDAKYNSVVWPHEYLLHPNLVRENYTTKIIKGWFTKTFTLTDSEHLELKLQRETYRQLKLISDRNKNLIDTLSFYKNEMRVYWVDMRFKNEMGKGDRFLLFLNRCVSNFGQSWRLPLLWLIITHTILFSIVISWYYYNDFTGEQEFGQYWVLLNPVHKTPEYINTGAGLFTEFMMRVLNGYFIYHFIKATRKFGRV